LRGQALLDPAPRDAVSISRSRSNITITRTQPPDQFGQGVMRSVEIFKRGAASTSPSEPHAQCASNGLAPGGSGEAIDRGRGN
jgi:hypothetical protein